MFFQSFFNTIFVPLLNHIERGIPDTCAASVLGTPMPGLQRGKYGIEFVWVVSGAV
jgi:hypothetical protein